MKVRMITKYASPRGTCMPGRCIDLPDDEAKALIQGRYAEPAKADKPEAVPAEKTEAKGKGKDGKGKE